MEEMTCGSTKREAAVEVAMPQTSGRAGTEESIEAKCEGEMTMDAKMSQTKRRD